MSTADYEILIDWFGSGDIISEFEGTIGEDDFDGWEAFGTTPPSLSISNNQAYSGDQSLLALWTQYNPFQFDVSGSGFDQGRFGTLEFGNSAESFQFDVAGHGFDDGRFGYAELSDPTVNAPAIHRVVEGLTVGMEYTVSARVLHPFTSDTPVKLGYLEGSEESAASNTAVVQWEELSFTFTATEETHTLTLFPTSEPDTGDRVHLDLVKIIRSGVDVTDRTLGRGTMSFRYGRDFNDRSRLRAAQAALELDNQSLDYMPENPNSPLAGFIGPGKPLKVSANFEGQNYPLLSAFIDEFEINPGLAEQKIEVSAIDLVGRMAQVKISTELFHSLQTGDAVNKVLDAIGWPAAERDIDQGATTIRWWWEDDTTALEAMNKIINSEGGPSFFHISPTGVAIFRDRHHRLPSNFAFSATTFRASGVEPLFSSPMSYDIGWRNIVNDIRLTVDERIPNTKPSKVWEDKQSSITVPEGETVTVVFRASEPFYDAIVPVEGIDFTTAGDSGTVHISLDRTSGQSATLSLQSVGATAVVQNLSVRATLVPVENTSYVHMQDVDSIAKYGIKTTDLDTAWAGKYDAVGIVSVLLGERGETLPIVYITVNNDGDERLREILRTELSDQIHIEEPTTFMDHEFYVDSIEHRISTAGLHHTATFGCERVRTQVDNVFTFDDPGAGFDDGLFGRSGIDDRDTVFTLDSSELDEGLLGH